MFEQRMEQRLEQYIFSQITPTLFSAYKRKREDDPFERERPPKQIKAVFSPPSVKPLGTEHVACGGVSVFVDRDYQTNAIPKTSRLIEEYRLGQQAVEHYKQGSRKNLKSGETLAEKKPAWFQARPELRPAHDVVHS